MSDVVLSVKGLRYSYGDLVAVDDISFEVERGQVFSFLGPNGAGKTTTINVLTTLLPLQAGKVTIAGFDLARQKDEVRRSVGIVFQDETLDRDMTVWETLEFHGRIYFLPKETRRARTDELLELVELAERRDDLVKTLSGGMRRRLEIARGLLTRPRVLFLDEPTLGLDPQARVNVWDYISKVNEEGTTIFLTTHNMDEADQLSDVIHIIDHGRIIARGTPEGLKDSMGKDVVYLEVDSPQTATEVLEDLAEVNQVVDSTRGLAVSLSAEGSRYLPGLMEALRSAAVRILSVSLKRPTLDDVFLHYTGRVLRDEEVGEGGVMPVVTGGRQ